MNIYEEQNLEQKLEELTDHMGHLVLDIILISLKKLTREYQVFSDIEDSRWSASPKNDPF